MKPSATKIPSSALTAAGLEIMRLEKNPLVRVPSKGRSQIFRTETGETVRVRTCNDHVLIAVADSIEPSASLNIEGTDFLLVVMPVNERTPGPVMAFLVPTQSAAEAIRASHAEWLAGNPRTGGENRTRSIWFDGDRSLPGHGFMELWGRFRLGSQVNLLDSELPQNGSRSVRLAQGGEPARSRQPAGIRLAGHGEQEGPAGHQGNKLGDVIARARAEIAEAAGVDISCVRISVDLT